MYVLALLFLVLTGIGIALRKRCVALKLRHEGALYELEAVRRRHEQGRLTRYNRVVDAGEAITPEAVMPPYKNVFFSDLILKVEVMEPVCLFGMDHR